MTGRERRKKNGDGYSLVGKKERKRERERRREKQKERKTERLTER